MATDFWASSHFKRWIIDREAVRQARREDLQYVDDPIYLDLLGIYFANLISKLGKKLQLRQRAIATATVFFRRFYSKNSYCETDPFMVIAACCYVAAKAEESPVHIKNVVTEARYLFGSEEYGHKSFPSDNSKLAEMEFYLVDDLECDLVVFHPYRTLIALCGKDTPTASEPGEAHGSSVSNQFWGTGEGKLELQEGALQMAWFIVNDTYRSDFCLTYPPHLIALAAIYLTLVFHSPTRDTLNLPSQNGQAHSQTNSQGPLPSPPVIRRSSRSTNSNLKRQNPQDPITFMAGLNVNISTIATLAQEILSLYTLWDRYKDDTGDPSAGSSIGDQLLSLGSSGTPSKAQWARSGSVLSGGTATSSTGTPISGEDYVNAQNHTHQQIPDIITPSFLTNVLHRMREAKMAEVNHGTSDARLIAFNKRLERAQAAA